MPIPILLEESRIFKIIDRSRRSTVRLSELPCSFCRSAISDRFYLSKRSNIGTKHYHIQCARRVGFEILDLS